MARFDIVMPKLGESIIEATITRWLKAEGDTIGEDEPIVEIATDKVDSEIPSPIEGVLKKILYKEGETIAVGEIIAWVEMDSGEETTPVEKESPAIIPIPAPATPVEIKAEPEPALISERFLSPLVKSMAKEEGIPASELNQITGTGKDGRLTKTDLTQYISTRSTAPKEVVKKEATPVPAAVMAAPPVLSGAGDQIIEMDRMRKLIADHMVMSVHTSPHVTSFVEVDMTAIVQWREKNKDLLLKRENEKLTYTHIFIEAIAKAIKDFPMVNSSVDGTRIIMRKNVNIGMAVALPTGNLIVPVIKSADQKNLLGIIKAVNDIADRARQNKLQPDEIQGGTITLTNLGSFGTLLGTPIINQPQVAIVAVGTIQKRPVVLETPQGDVIAIRHMMYLSLSYDHRVIDGALGGKFIYKMKENLENFDIQQSI